jgi:hypothetical protein
VELAPYWALVGLEGEVGHQAPHDVAPLGADIRYGVPFVDCPQMPADFPLADVEVVGQIVAIGRGVALPPVERGGPDVGIQGATWMDGFKYGLLRAQALSQQVQYWTGSQDRGSSAYCVITDWHDPGVVGHVGRSPSVVLDVRSV